MGAKGHNTDTLHLMPCRSGASRDKVAEQTFRGSRRSYSEFSNAHPRPAPGGELLSVTVKVLLQFAVVFEDFFPVNDQRIERFFGSAFVGHHVVVYPLLHRQQQLRVRRVCPEVNHHAH
jgi:hypothetical protein